jgi:oxygen-independent coproporphyrinogen III oxidase
MAGIYIHIPFCKQACHYCDFHFATSLKYKDEMISAILHEIELQKNYLGGENIETIYFGGGTPSLLSSSDLQKIFDKLFHVHQVMPGVEITLEANPDDLNKNYLDDLRKTPVNRFSIGVQSFFDEDLKWMNRAHQAEEAENSIKRSQDSGFENITIDLIYGYPLLSSTKWKYNIDKAVSLGIPHLSSYSMTVEPNTALDHFIRNKKQVAMNEDQSAEQYEFLMHELNKAGYIHYEVSSFSKKDQYSRHNSNYWKGEKYLGLGPSAHSFNKTERSWNIANNIKYIEAIEQKKIPAETEVLTREQLINEHLMISLRTMWGFDLQKINSQFGSSVSQAIQQRVVPFIEKGWLQKTGNIITTTKEGKLFADKIASELFITENYDR